MVSRASAVGCHPLREVPSLIGRRSTSLKRQVLRTRRPTGLDRTTLTGKRCLVKPKHEGGLTVLVDDAESQMGGEFGLHDLGSLQGDRAREVIEQPGAGAEND